MTRWDHAFTGFVLLYLLGTWFTLAWMAFRWTGVCR